jgi:hypothetical protein
MAHVRGSDADTTACPHVGSLSSQVHAPTLSHTIVTHGARNTTEPAGPSEGYLSQLPWDADGAAESQRFAYEV